MVKAECAKSFQEVTLAWLQKDRDHILLHMYRQDGYYRSHSYGSIISRLTYFMFFILQICYIHTWIRISPSKWLGKMMTQTKEIKGYFMATWLCSFKCPFIIMQAGLYNPAVAPQYYPTMYATSPTAVGPPPYPYGSYHAYGQTAPGASFTGPQVPHHQLPLSTYLRYPAQPVEGFSSPASWGQPFPFSPSAPAVSRLPVDPSSSGE